MAPTSTALPAIVATSSASSGRSNTEPPMTDDSRIRLAVYHHFTERGRTPTLSELATTLALPEPDIRAAVQRLHDAHMLVLDPTSGEVLMANPFSAVPTSFEVSTTDFTWWANCIWDS